jgi:cobyrinic acid a,c-diamide synthase
MQQEEMDFPRIIVAALRGGSGKTILSIGIIAALCSQDKRIAPFKKGPDYIDAGWLALAAGRPCFNLDSFLLEPQTNIQSFLFHSHNCDIAVIEGNRGLYDGIDLEGTTSTAELAKLLKVPVVLCVDCTKITRTMAAVVAGCIQFDPDVSIKGVILNRVANARHEKKLRDSIEHYCNIPVLGAIPKLGEQHFPERHLGLVPTAEHDWAKDSVAAAAKIAEKHIDLEAIEAIARQAPKLKTEAIDLNAEWGMRPATSPSAVSSGSNGSAESNAETRDLRPEDQSLYRESRIQHQVSGVKRPATSNQQPEANDQKPVSSIEQPAPRIGILKDAAFQFYYPENIDALSAEGAEIVFLSPLKDKALPELDALYIGGGFPETHARELADNTMFSRPLKMLADNGFPIYAECGGLMYLGEELILDDVSYPMAGVLPIVFGFYQRPQGHGYTIASVEGQNPYYPVGTEIKGHEFHYSRVLHWSGQEKDLVFRMKRGVGIQKDKEGILYKNVLATYMHIHALGTAVWAKALVRNAVEYHISKRDEI